GGGLLRRGLRPREVLPGRPRDPRRRRRLLGRPRSRPRQPGSCIRRFHRGGRRERREKTENCGIGFQSCHGPDRIGILSHGAFARRRTCSFFSFFLAPLVVLGVGFFFWGFSNGPRRAAAEADRPPSLLRGHRPPVGVLLPQRLRLRRHRLRRAGNPVASGG